MKQSTLLGKAIRAFRADLRRVERKIEAFDRSNAARIIGPEKAARDKRRLELVARKALLENEIRKTQKAKTRALVGERYWENQKLPDGYMRPSEANNKENTNA